MKRISNLGKFFGMLVLVALMACTFAICVSAGTYSDVEDSIVAVINEDDNTYCTGIAVGESGKAVRYILTSSEIINVGFTDKAVVYFSFASDKKALATVHYVDLARGFAILKLPEATKDVKPAVFCPSKKVSRDSTYAGICFPDNLSSTWNNNTDETVNLRATINKKTKYNNIDVYDVKMDVDDVALGGPLVNSDGQVVGMIIDNIDGYALVSDEVLEVLDDEKISYTVAGAISTTLLIIIIGAAVLVVVIVLVIVLVVSSGKKKNAAAAAASQGMTQAMDYSAPAPAPVAPMPAAPAVPSMRVLSIGGVLNGKTFAVNGSVKVGRDASKCEIAYPVNTQGVSACHCELTFDGTVCYLKDMKSSFGTFLADGTKLAPYAPQMLRSGDKFYLAGPENMFEVRF